MDKTCVILNPAAGSITDVDTLVTVLKSVGGFQVEISAKRGAVEQLTRTALRKGCRVFIAAGGDGTLNEVVNALGEDARDIRVGLLPLGTGNDFARTLGLPTQLKGALDVLRAGRTRAIDLVRVTSDRIRYFVNVSAGGFSGVVNEKLTPEMKESWGPLAYVRSAAAALPELRAYGTNVALGNEECISMDLYNVVIANGRYVAGGTPIAPEASIDDGLLDVVLLSATSAAQLALLMPQILLGTHLSNSAVVFRRASKVTVNSRPGMWFNVDGELVGNEPAVFQVLPRALQFIVA
ncbi:MAG: diacylglycerol/lipid kinase family protein [Chthoniobacterales bacterium]